MLNLQHLFAVDASVIVEVFKADTPLSVKAHFAFQLHPRDLKDIQLRQILGTMLEKAAVIRAETVFAQRLFRFIDSVQVRCVKVEIALHLGIPGAGVGGNIVDRKERLDIQLSVSDILLVYMDKAGFGDLVPELSQDIILKRNVGNRSTTTPSTAIQALS
nr:hypothetical protein [uncultured Ruminococcus sp.]